MTTIKNLLRVTVRRLQRVLPLGLGGIGPGRIALQRALASRGARPGTASSSSG